MLSVILVLICFSTTCLAQGQGSSPENTENGRLVPAEPSTAIQIREAVLNGDVETIATLLASEASLRTLAAGFTFENNAVLRRSPNADLVALQGVALYVRQNRDVFRIAALIIIESFFLGDGDSVLDDEELLRLLNGFTEILGTPAEITRILKYDSTPDSPSGPSPGPISVSASATAIAGTGSTASAAGAASASRGLLMTTPVDSFFCASCNPRRVCRICSWC